MIAETRNVAGSGSLVGRFGVSVIDIHAWKQQRCLSSLIAVCLGWPNASVSVAVADLCPA